MRIQTVEENGYVYEVIYDDNGLEESKSMIGSVIRAKIEGEKEIQISATLPLKIVFTHYQEQSFSSVNGVIGLIVNQEFTLEVPIVNGMGEFDFLSHTAGVFDLEIEYTDISIPIQSSFFRISVIE